MNNLIENKKYEFDYDTLYNYNYGPFRKLRANKNVNMTDYILSDEYTAKFNKLLREYVLHKTHYDVGLQDINYLKKLISYNYSVLHYKYTKTKSEKEFGDSYMGYNLDFAGDNTITKIYKNYRDGKIEIKNDDFVYDNKDGEISILQINQYLLDTIYREVRNNIIQEIKYKRVLNGEYPQNLQIRPIIDGLKKDRPIYYSDSSFPKNWFDRYVKY